MRTNLPSIVTGETSIPLKKTTIGKLLANAAATNPDHLALVSMHQKTRLSYAELNQKVDDFAKGLVQLGLVHGDRIGIWSPNNVEWIITMFAAAKVGLVLVNINPAYKASELKYALNKVECKALVMARQFKSSIYTNVISQLAPEVASSEAGQLVSVELPKLTTLILIDSKPEPGYMLFDNVMAEGASDVINLPLFGDLIQPDSPVNIQFTSGTTGAPKGATLTHNNIINNAYFVGLGINLSSTDIICSPVPLYHCFGMVLAVLAAVNFSASVVLPALSYDPISTLEAIEQEKCTALYGVPTMFNMILNEDKIDDFELNSLRTGVVAGSLCPKETMSKMIDKLNMREVTNCYGMTETSPVSFQTGLHDSFSRRTTTVGKVMQHMEVKLVDDDGNIVPIGQRGEICTSGYCVMQGYWGDPEKTADSIRDGWMHTGDEGVLDEQGYLKIVGRIKDTIIRGGENIAPKEIEQYLFSHEAIQEVQVFGVSDVRFGEVVCAWIQLASGHSMDSNDVKSYCEGQIAHFKIPTLIKFVDEFPLTVTGKFQKYKMRQLMEEELGIEHSS